MPFTSSVMRQRVSNFRLYCCSKKFQILRKNVKSLLEQLQVCIFAEIVFGVRSTLSLEIAYVLSSVLLMQAHMTRNQSGFMYSCPKIVVRRS